MSCPICGSDQTQTKARQGIYDFLACTSCGVFFVSPMPEGDAVPEAGAHYTRAYYSGEMREDEDAFESASIEGATKRLERIEALLGTRGLLVDVGTGTGYQLAAARQRGWHVKGVEISLSAVEYARQTHGVDVMHGTLQQAQIPSGSVHAVILSHVLEHVPNPLALLREVRRIIVPTGVLAVAVPNSRALLYRGYNLYHRVTGHYGKDKFSCSLAPPSHLYAFDVPSLTHALQQTGFAVSSMTVTGKGDPEHYPVVSWKGAGRLAPVVRVLETFGRKTGSGSLIECLARPA